MKKLVLAGVLAAIALVSLPAASFAYGGGSPVVTGTVAPTKTVSVDFPAGFFANAEAVAMTVSCTSGDAKVLNTPAIAVFRAFPRGPFYLASGDGSFSLQLTLPADDFGTCTVTYDARTLSASGTADLTYVPAAAVAYTGFDAGLYIWTASGVIVLGGALISVMVARRKAQTKASA